VCMLDRAGLWDSPGLGYSNEFFRFSTTALQWEELDAALVSGSPPSARDGHTMAAVGSDIFVFGGVRSSEGTLGEEARCACWPPSGVMSDIDPTITPRACARAAAWSRAGVLCLSAPGWGGTSALCWHRASQRAHPDEHVHDVAHREPHGAPGVPCRG
jgi:hypothetical protein